MFWAMGHAEGKDPDKKHRHDVGDVDHGPLRTERTTKSLQGILGLCIFASAGLAVYAIALALGV